MSVSGKTLGFGQRRRSRPVSIAGIRERRATYRSARSVFAPLALGRNDERHRVHSDARDASLNPKAHDFTDLSLHLRVGGNR